MILMWWHDFQRLCIEFTPVMLFLGAILAYVGVSGFVPSRATDDKQDER